MTAARNGEPPDDLVTLLDRAVDVIAVVDVSGHIAYVNETVTATNNCAVRPTTRCGGVNPPIAYTTATLMISLMLSVVTSQPVNTKSKLHGLTTMTICAEQLNAATSP